MSKNSIFLGYDLTMDKDEHTLRPLGVHFWQNEAKFKKNPPTPPFKYFADALVGLSTTKLNHFFKKTECPPLVAAAWEKLDPHHHLFEHSQERVKAIQTQIAITPPKITSEFENHFNSILENAQKPWGIDISSLAVLVEKINWLEEKMKNPLLFNFHLRFSKEFIEQLHALYSLLFNVRSVVAVDYNAHISDPSHEAIVIDSLADYLPKAEYIVNDALIYWQFKKLTQPYQVYKRHESPVENLLVVPMTQTFKKYAHNACQLIENLSKSFLDGMNIVELEEALYLVQMDWLLGSHSGLLFRIREELYGITEGYEKVFWNDKELNQQAPAHLSIHCEISPHDLEKQAA